MPDRSPEKFSKAEWISYSRQVLHEYAPEDGAVIDKAKIVISLNAASPTGSYWLLKPQVLVLNYGVIQLVSNEEELAVVLLHELGHLKLKQIPPITIDDDGIPHLDTDQLFVLERDADEFARERIMAHGGSACSSYAISKKIFFSLGNSPTPTDAKRLEL